MMSQLFFCSKINLKHQLVTSSDARSDHSAFLDVGIPGNSGQYSTNNIIAQLQ